MSKRILLQVLWLAIGLYACFALSKSLWQLYQAGQRVTTQEEKLEGLAKTVAELKNKLEYVKSYQFVEQEARNKLNLQRPGELVLVPAEAKPAGRQAGEGAEKEMKNWQKWLSIFL